MSLLKEFQEWKEAEYGSDSEVHDYDDVLNMLNKVRFVLEQAENDECEGCKYKDDPTMDIYAAEMACRSCRNNYENNWAPKQLKKTRQSEFLKMFPNAKFGEYDFGRALIIDPCDVNETLGELTDYRDGDNDCKRFIKYGDCGRCKDAYWNEEVE